MKKRYTVRMEFMLLSITKIKCATIKSLSDERLFCDHLFFSSIYLSIISTAPSMPVLDELRHRS